jgi:hypothetical protein
MPSGYVSGPMSPRLMSTYSRNRVELEIEDWEGSFVVKSVCAFVFAASSLSNLLFRLNVDQIKTNNLHTCHQYPALQG